VGFDSSTTNQPGKSYGNIYGGSAPSDWTDLFGYGYGGCYAVNMTNEGCAVETGACCDHATGDCVDNTLENECTCPQCEWFPGQMCDEIDCDIIVEYCSYPNITIPDCAYPNGAEDTMTITDTGTITDLDVDVTIYQTWIGDLCVKLEMIGGPEIILVLRIGDSALGCDTGGCCGCSADNIICILDDEGTSGNINDACPPVPGNSYVPEEALSAFDGVEFAGDWKMTVIDNACGDEGTLSAWCLLPTLETGPQPGACCFDDGSCEETLEDDCTGSSFIPGGVCDPNPCPQPTGACCDDITADCTETTEEECADMPDHTYQGDGTTCDPNPCPLPGDEDEDGDDE
jgi:subtilisin-like proprotein convertase family protein